VRWYRDRLGKPPDVEKVGADWRQKSDQVSRFVEDCCVIDPSAHVPARALYLAYKKWAEEASERVETETSFADRLLRPGQDARIKRRVGDLRGRWRVVGRVDEQDHDALPRMGWNSSTSRRRRCS
jgi:phage/plasmid-associated DNA primase